MSYKYGVTVISVPISHQANEDLKKLANVYKYKSKTRLAKDILEKTIANSVKNLDKKSEDYGS